jgi:hypothetical protein
MTDLIDAAPWMLTLLAEKSLAERKQRLTVAETAFEEAMERLPDHLGHGNLARTDFENACGDEEASISERDIFGETILNSGAASFVEPPFESLITNPFADFLRRTATEIGSNEINADHCEIPFGGDLPKWPVFTAWFDELTGEDWLAEHAIDKQYVKIGAIPPELLGTEKRTERVDWLIQQIPADERDRLIQDAARQLQELGVKL